MVEAGFVAGLLVDCSFREEFLAVTGILPDIYLAALPAPGLMGGNRRAMIDVERGMMVVSSSYSGGMLVVQTIGVQLHQVLTFIAIFVVDREVEICSITKAALDDDITFEFKYRDTSPVKFHSGRLLLGFELEKY